MARPSKSGREASREALDYINHWLCQIVDLMSEDLTFKQRHRLRVQIIKYILKGDRMRSKDAQIQKCFESIVLNYINADETL